MSFESFAAQHGLIIKNLIADRWVRVPTTDHPHKRNGSYFYAGDSGAVQNWAVHSKPISWRSESYFKIDYRQIEEKRRKNLEMIRKNQEKAAKKAAWIMHNAKKGNHDYLVKKGFPNESAWVWNTLMVVPMRINNSLVGCQLISPDGTKRFLTGQRTKSACATFDNKGVEILCEGYATALSIRRALKAVKSRYKIIVCFSAGNIIELAKYHKNACLVADNDITGIKTAIKTGLPYWSSDVEGEDFNDAELRVGAHSAGKWLLDVFGSRLLSVD